MVDVAVRELLVKVKPREVVSNEEVPEVRPEKGLLEVEALLVVIVVNPELLVVAELDLIEELEVVEELLELLEETEACLWKTFKELIFQN